MSNLSEVWLNALAYWKGLSRREQLMSLVAGGFIAIWLVRQAVFMPLIERRELAERKLESSQEQLMNIQQQASEVIALRKDQPGKARYLGLPLDDVVNRTSRDHSIRITGVRSQRDSLQVSLDTVGFNRLLDWLVVLEEQGGAKVMELDVEAFGKPGQVRVEALRIQRG